MNRQQTLLAGVVLGAAAAIGLIIHLTRSDRPGAPGHADVRAAEPAPADKSEPSGRTVIRETLTGHKYEARVFAYEEKPREVSMWAFRLSTGGVAKYFVRLPFEHTVYISAEDAASLMKFHDRVKGKKLESKHFTTGAAEWECRTAQGRHFNLYRQLVVSYDLKGQKFSRNMQMGDGTWSTLTELPDAFFTALADVLKEVEASKGEKPAVEP